MQSLTMKLVYIIYLLLSSVSTCTLILYNFTVIFNMASWTRPVRPQVIHSGHWTNNLTPSQLPLLHGNHSLANVTSSREKPPNEVQTTGRRRDGFRECGGRPQTNLVFVKTHKTGSTTLAHIINRFGYTRNLSFVLNKKNSHNGHIRNIPLTKESPRRMFLPPLSASRNQSRFKYNIMNVHVRYNRPVMDFFMASPTYYVTILRDPGYQFESQFHHFGCNTALSAQERKKFNTTASQLNQFLQKEGKIRSMCPPNSQIFDMGLDHKYHGNQSIVSFYIKKLELELDLVLINEYYDESLLLLKTLLCWDMSDVLYVAKNVRAPLRGPVSESLRNKMREWNPVDVQLYAHFNKSLWSKIEQYGPTFESDLATFRGELKETLKRCATDLKIVTHMTRHFEYGVKEGSGLNCTLIAMEFKTLFRQIWIRATGKDS